MSAQATLRNDPLGRTLPGRLAWWAKERPDQVALRHKQLGIWHEISWGEYLAEVEGGRVAAGAIRRLREGVELDDGPTAPARVSQPQPGVVRITIHEGRNRQVRRMCEAVGHPVRRLVRTRIGPIADRALAPGTWRELTGPELRSLTEAVAGSARQYDSQP